LQNKDCGESTIIDNNETKNNANQPKKIQQNKNENEVTNIIQSKASILLTSPNIIPISNETSNKDDNTTTLRDTNVELLNEINNGHFQLKKVVTIEKTGIEYIIKKGND